MPRYTATVTSSWPARQAFDYMADFSNAAEWDPGVASARRLDAGSLRTGSAFELEVRFAGRTLPMRYVITDLHYPRVTFTARSRMLESVDTVSVRERNGTTEVTYDARLTLRGPARLANPLLARGFRGVAERAGASLGRRLLAAP